MFLFEQYTNKLEYATLIKGQMQACASMSDVNPRSDGYGKPCGVGIYCTDKIETAEKYTSQVNLNGKNIKIALQCRINPKKFRNTDSKDGGGGLYYIINNSEDIRPYGILFKIE